METSERKRWLGVAAVLGLLYCLIGFAFAKLAGSAASNEMRYTWNRLAFLTSGIVFAFHIGYEHFRLSSWPRTTALHTALAVAVGALGLALLANIHELQTASSYRPRLLVALVAWPLLTGVPAFIVAFISAAGLNLGRRKN